MNIVSLLPSATELICKLGLQDQLVGVSHECDFPPGVASLPKVTQTLIDHDVSSGEIDAQVKRQLENEKSLYSLNVDALIRLQPDVIVTQALCQVCAVAESEVRRVIHQLPNTPQVINLEPTRLHDIFDLIDEIARVCGQEDIAETVVRNLSGRIDQLARRSQRMVPKAKRPRVAFFEWIDPVFGPGHWNPEIIELAGGIDCLGQVGQPSQCIEWSQVVDAQPDVLFIACCGYPVKRSLRDMAILESREDWHALPCVRNDQIFLCDGNAYFARPGPRLVDSLAILANALHPTIHPVADNTPVAHRYEPIT